MHLAGDPADLGLLLYLLATGVGCDEIEEVLNHGLGLLGISGVP